MGGGGLVGGAGGSEGGALGVEVGAERDVFIAGDAGFGAGKDEGFLGDREGIFEGGDAGVALDEGVFVGDDLDAGGFEEGVGLFAEFLVVGDGADGFVVAGAGGGEFALEVLGVVVGEDAGFFDGRGALALGGEQGLEVGDVVVGKFFADEAGVAVGGEAFDVFDRGAGVEGKFELAHEVGEQIGG